MIKTFHQPFLGPTIFEKRVLPSYQWPHTFLATFAPRPLVEVASLLGFGLQPELFGSWSNRLAKCFSLGAIVFWVVGHQLFLLPQELPTRKRLWPLASTGMPPPQIGKRTFYLKSWFLDNLKKRVKNRIYRWLWARLGRKKSLMRWLLSFCEDFGALSSTEQMERDTWNQQQRPYTIQRFWLNEKVQQRPTKPLWWVHRQRLLLDTWRHKSIKSKSFLFTTR